MKLSLLAALTFLCAAGGASVAGCGRVAGNHVADADAGLIDKVIDAPSPVDPMLDAVCDGVPGLTARVVLDAVNRLPRALAATFRRLAPDDPHASDHPSALTLRFRYENGAVRCNPAVHDPPGTPNPSATPASVELVVTVDFITADGLFAESFPAAVTSTGSTFTFNGDVAVADINGSYAAMAVGDVAGSATNVGFGGMIFPDALQYCAGSVVHGSTFGEFDSK